MIILGISGAFGHDAAACIIKNGEVIAMAEEERFVRKKHAPHALPINASLYCLNEAGISFSDVDLMSASWNPNLPSPVKYLKEYADNFVNHIAWRAHRRPVMQFYDHHLAHAASAFFSSGFDEAAIIVIDGNGEDASTSIGYGRDGGVFLEQKISIRHSLGHLFKSATIHIGLDENDEGKMMGLAAYGNRPRKIDLIQLTSDGYLLNLNGISDVDQNQFFSTYYRSLAECMNSNFGPQRFADVRWNPQKNRVDRQIEFLDGAANIAASIQSSLVETLLHLAKIATQRYGLRKLVLAGGVALNCSANGELLNSNVIDNLFVFPAANDSGGAIGAAYLACIEHDMKQRIFPYTFEPFLGPSFDIDIIIDQLKRYGISFTEPDDIFDFSANLLQKGAVIGWFSGRMEIGPRALGNRSILALPINTAIRDRVNRIKGRELWRPLSPSILGDAISELLIGREPSPFMLTAVPATNKAKELMPAVVHVDGTFRPQVVSPKQESYYHLLTAVNKLCGIPALLNTSFNIAGEPIVCTPTDAIRTFVSSELDALVLESFIIQKTGIFG